LRLFIVDILLAYYAKPKLGGKKLVPKKTPGNTFATSQKSGILLSTVMSPIIKFG